jgi:nucleoid DNA-binding protein
VDIAPFIRELLFGYDCVIVPGFGGFIGNYTPARIDKTTGTFYPPVKQISFNRNLNHNDGLLVGKISGTSINYGDTRNIVEEYVGELRKKLGRGDKVVLDNIGSFVNNQEGNIQFEPDMGVNYHLGSYGLESFQCMPLEGYDVRKRIMKHPGKDPVRQASIRKIMWRAAVIIPLLSVLVAVPLKTDLFKSKVESTTLNPLVTAEFEHNKNAVREMGNEAEAETDKIVQPAEEKTVIPEVVLPAASETNEYYVITGSFKSETYAVAQVNKLKEEGYTPEIIVAPNGFYRVSAMMVTDLNTALGDTITNLPSLSSAISIIPFDSIPLIVLGSRLAIIDICLPASVSGSKYSAIPETIVRISIPVSIVSLRSLLVLGTFTASRIVAVLISIFEKSSKVIISFEGTVFESDASFPFFVASSLSICLVISSSSILSNSNPGLFII